MRETDNVPGVVPEAVERTAQYAPLVAVQEIVPVPPFVIERLCASGTAPPDVYAKLRVCGATISDAGAPVTTRVTVTVWGLLEAPAAAI